MKPTPPDEQELEEMSAEVSEQYRASSQEEPSARLDAAVRMAARREVAQPARPRRAWQVPASIAAVVVIGVSLLLVARENEPPLPSMERSAAPDAQLAKKTPAESAQKRPARQLDDLQRERPSRERSARPDRNAESVAEPASPPASAETNAAVALQRREAEPGTASGSVGAPAPTAPAAAAAPKAKQALTLDARESSEQKVEESRAPDAPQRAARADAPAAQAEAWLRRIDALIARGEEVQARAQLQAFRKQYPGYPLSARQQALLPEAQR